MTINNIGNISVDIRDCYFTLSGSQVRIELDRSSLITMEEGLPQKLDAGEECVIKYPAYLFWQLTGVAIKEKRGKFWHVSGKSVKKAAKDMITLLKRNKIEPIKLFEEGKINTNYTPEAKFSRRK